MPSASNQLIDTRIAFTRCGVDYGSDAKVLLAKGLFRLVWAKATKTLIGIRGCGHTSSPCSLELREFRLDGERLSPKGSETLFSGGRLSHARLLSVSDKIDSVFGDGVTAALDYRKTTIIGLDEVGVWLELQSKKEEEYQRQNALRWKKQIAELPNMTFDGIKL